ncbi:MAG: hypothetical protein M3Y76_10600 [Chloroflexota bacterium]|nr:hypothetical protein [Chloroflexota bacterium]
MTRKKEDLSPLSQEENAQVQHLLEQLHGIANTLHASTNEEEAKGALSEINNLTEAAQVALLKALSKEHESDAADIVLALNELSPNKSVRKEARRSLFRLEEAKVYPQWKLQVVHPPVVGLPSAHQPRFWRGYVTQSREEGEVQLILSWEQGIDYSEVRMFIFILDFWERGLKEFINDTTNKRSVETQIQHLRTQLKDITIVDCTLAEGRRLLEEALAVNAWRGTTPHKEYRHYLPLFKQLVTNAEEVGEDRGLSFINPALEIDEVAATFVGAWSLGDFGLSYDLLSSNSQLRDGLERAEWIERHHNWATEARPSRFDLSFIRDREISKPALWLPSSASGRSGSSLKEVEIGWSLELSETQLSGTLKEMPMGTVVNKETGRHWFWTSYTLVREQERWRIRQMTDEGARVQGLPAPELQQRIKEHDEHINGIMQQNPGDEQKRQLSGELVWRITQTIHYDDALIVHFPLDRTFLGDAYNRSIGIGAIERGEVYLERLARNFAEQRGELLRLLSITQQSLAVDYRERGMEARGEQFDALAETSIRESLALQNDIAGHAVLAELLMRQGEKLDEAESELQLARELATTSEEEAMIESDMGNIATERKDLEGALRHYQRVAEIEPNFEGIWFRIGFMQRNLQRFEEAKATYLHAIERKPQEMPPYSELCTIYLNERELGKAREIVERGLRNIPRSAHLLALLSSTYLESGDLRRAQATLAEAEQIEPTLEIVQGIREELNRRTKK